MGKNIYTIPSEDRAYLYYEVKSPSGEILVSFYTNRAHEGKFYYDEENGTYKQTMGTCDFDMPLNRDSARAKLYRMAKEAESEEEC